MARTKAFDEIAVLEKAMALFWKKGYHDTSMSDLVKELGLSRSSIYDTFKDKYGLFLASLQHYKKQATPFRLHSYIGKQFDLQAFLTAFFQSHISDCQQDPESKGCFFVNCSIEMAPHDQTIDQIVQANMDAFVENFSLLFEDQIKQGVLSKDKDPRALARFLYANISSIKLISRTSSDVKVLEDIAATAVQAVIA